MIRQKVHKQFARDLLVPMPDEGGVIAADVIRQWLIQQHPLQVSRPGYVDRLTKAFQDLNKPFEEISVAEALRILAREYSTS